MRKLRKLLKNHYVYFIIIILVTVFYFNAFFNERVPSRDLAGYHLPNAQTLKISALEYGDFWPMWTPYGFAGTPFLMKPVNGFDSLIGLMILIIPNTAIAMKMTYVLLFLISGITMYLLMFYLRPDKKIALIAALFYILNGHVAKLLKWGWLTTLGGYSIMPLIILFTYKAIKEKNWVFNSVITGILWAILYRFDPSMKSGLLFAIMYALFIIFNLIGKNFKERFLKISSISIIILVVLLSLSAQRILPMKEYLDISARASTTWEVSSSRQLKSENIFDRLVEPVKNFGVRKDGLGDKIGFVGFFLVLYGVSRKWKNKTVLFFSLTAILGVLVATNSFNLYRMIWQLPLFNSMRYMDRILILFVFSTSILAGIGAYEFFKKNKKYKTVAFYSILFLIFIDLWVFNYIPYSGNPKEWSNANDAIDQNHILQELTNRDGLFRIQTFETRGIDWGTQFWNVPLKLEHIYRYDTLWYPPYMNGFLGVANEQPARFWGIMNVKYVTSTQKFNISGFKFVDEFDRCESCFPNADLWKKAWGPFLYENEEFLPRAYIVDNTVLVVGSENSVQPTMYGLMLLENFNPQNTAIVRGKNSINGYSLQELGKFDVVFLTQGSIDQNSLGILQEYKNAGGIILPDITINQDEVSSEAINSLLGSFTGSLQEINEKDIIMHNFDTREIKLNGQTGFLVISEKFAIYDGWNLKINNKNSEKFVTNVMNTGIHLSGNENSLKFNFSPKSHQIGTWITVIAIVLLLLFFILRKKQKNEI